MRRGKNGYWYAAAFLLPVVCFTLLSVEKGMYPFGGVSNYWEDLQIQYHDFLCYWKDVLAGDASAAYSFSKSLGGSTTALVGYYLLSPLNLLAAFFRKDQMQMFIYVITCLKLGLCGLFFCVYASRRFDLSGPVRAALSLAYAFTQYGVGQNTNIMWMDGVYLLPLVMLGVYLYVAEDRRTPLYVSVACSVVFNWYTGYMNCLFAAVYFVFEMILREKRFSPRRLLGRTVGFGMTALLGVLLSGAVILPVFLGQNAGRSIERNFFQLTTNGSLLDILNGLIIGAAFPSVQITLFCTTAALLAFFSLWFLKNVSVREKAAAGLLVGAMAASMFFKPLENIWCGFRFEWSYQYRFGYASTAAMLTAAAMALEKLRGQAARDHAVLKGAGALTLALLLADWVSGFWAVQLWLQIGLIAAYVCLIYGLDRARRLPRRRWTAAAVRGAAVCAAALYLGEVLFNAVMVQGERNIYDAAVNRDYTSAQQELIDRLRPADTEFYRIEQTLSRGGEGAGFYANESLAYGYEGIQSYTSCYDGPVARMIARAGYCAVSFPSFYKAPILPMDSFLGVKYLLSPKAWSGFEKTDIPGANGKDVYQNPYAFPFGFGVAAGADGPVEGERFDYANSLYTAVLGERTEVFCQVEPVSVETDGADRVYRFAAGEGADGPLYMAMDGSESRCDEVLVDGSSLGDYDKSAWGAFNDVFYLGESDAIEEVVLRGCEMRGEEQQVRFCRVDMQTLAAAAQTLWDKAVEISEVRDGYVRASYTAPEAGQVLLTIPYERGWHAAVNGQSVQIRQGADIFTLIPVQAGDNEIVLEYAVRGRYAGAALSVFSLALFAAWSVFRRKRHAEER